jgi:flagellar basal-body rod protein FlgG
MYAIAENGSKQYKAEIGSVIRFEKLSANVGDKVEFSVLLISDENGNEVDRFKIVRFDNERYLNKMGSSLYNTNDIAGDAYIAEGNERPTLIQSYLESSNVNVVNEMVQMIEVNRAYEANQKTIQAEDSMMSTLWSRVAVKA